MSNRRKLKRRRGVPRENLGASRVSIPEDEKTVVKTVPAKVNGEVVGKAVIYSDGTTDMLINDDISDGAKAAIRGTVEGFNEENETDFTVRGVLGKEI